MELPELPEPQPRPGPDRLVGYSVHQTRAYGIACAQAALDAAAKVCEAQNIPVGNSAAGEMAADWTLDALREVRDAIRAIQVQP